MSIIQNSLTNVGWLPPETRNDLVREHRVSTTRLRSDKYTFASRKRQPDRYQHAKKVDAVVSTLKCTQYRRTVQQKRWKIRERRCMALRVVSGGLCNRTETWKSMLASSMIDMDVHRHCLARSCYIYTIEAELGRMSMIWPSIHSTQTSVKTLKPLVPTAASQSSCFKLFELMTPWFISPSIKSTPPSWRQIWQRLYLTMCDHELFSFSNVPPTSRTWRLIVTATSPELLR